MKTLVRILAIFICVFTLIGVLSSCEGMDVEGIIGDIIGGDDVIGDILGDGDVTGDENDKSEECSHLYGDWKEVKRGYCDEKKFQRTCQICGIIDRREGTYEDHWWSEYETILPTCQNGGIDRRMCDLCYKIETTNETEPTGEHTLGWFKIDNSSHHSYCENCKSRFNSDEHSFDNNDICKICGHDKNSVVYDITLWVSEKYGVADMFAEQIYRFMTENPTIRFNFTIEGVTEVDAGSMVVADVDSAADLFCFPQDQFARLVQAGALAPLSSEMAETIKSRNDGSSVRAASVGDTLYAYPMTSDNGYYLYYDKSIITNPESLEDIIADCEANGKTFRYALDNAWYTASFFFATGCHSNWTMDEDGNFNAIDDTFNSPEGLIAMKAMQKLAQSSCYDYNADIFTNAGAIVTGIWNAQAAENHFGENLGATDLPSFTVDGKTYHLGSYSGNKLIGIKPQEDEEKARALSMLAEFLTRAELQMELSENFQWGPSNLEAQQSEAVQSNPHLSALLAQNAYAQPQGNISGSWWDIAKCLGIKAETAKTDAELQEALNEYDKDIQRAINSETLPDRWSVIGSILGTRWDEDIMMTEESDGVWITDVLYLNKDEEFKVRKNESWDVNFGSDGFAGENFVIEEDGYYVIRLTVISDNDVAVEIIPAT